MAIVSGIDLGERPMSALFADKMSQSDRDFFNDKYRSMVDRLQNIDNRHRDRLQSIQRAYESVNYVDAARALDSVETRLGLDRLKILNDSNYEEQPNNRTLRYLMSQPEVRRRVSENRLDGFSNLFIDPEPKPINGDHRMRRDYLRTMDGVLYYDDKKLRVDNVYIIGDTETLSTADKHTVLSSWFFMIEKMREGLDPTDNNLGIL